MTTNISGSHTQFFMCEIRKKGDPNSANKVQVMIHGHHNVGDSPVPDDQLPWAHCMLNNSPSLNGFSQSVNYLPGSCCVGFWLDPETKQIPIVLGSVDRADLPDYSS